jgi:hypothetical protein
VQTPDQRGRGVSPQIQEDFFVTVPARADDDLRSAVEFARSEPAVERAALACRDADDFPVLHQDDGGMGLYRDVACHLCRAPHCGH